MIRLLLAALAGLFLSSCLGDFDLDIPWPETAALSAHIEIGGGGSFRLDSLNIRSSKQGEEGNKQVVEYIEAFKKEDWANESPFAGCTEVSHEIGYGAQGRLNAHIQGRFPDIFVLLRNLGKSEPSRLRRHETFSHVWDGNVLSVKWGSRTAKPPTSETDDRPQFKLTITTDGEFMSASQGRISEDRKKLVISDMLVVRGDWGFSIRGLAAD